MNPELTSQSAWLRRYTKVVAASTLFLIFAGAMVTSTGSGLAVPDWPLSFGMLMPPMVGGIFYEHGHRMIAAAVGLLTLIQAIWLQRRDPRRFVRVLGWVAAVAVIVQGLLGGLTVILLLPPAISIAHAGLAEIFFCLNVSIAFFSSTWFRESAACSAGVPPAFGRGERKAGGTPALHGGEPTGSATLLVGLVYMQILAGALMRHLGAGLAIPDFPLSFGRLVPSFTTTAIAVNYAHRLGAVIVAVAVAFLAVRLLRHEAKHPLRRIANLLVGVVAAQVLLGAFTVWSGKQPVLTSLHVMTGALTLAISLVLALVAHSRGPHQAQSSTALAGRYTPEVPA